MYNKHYFLPTSLSVRKIYFMSGAAGCVKGFSTCFLKVPLAGLGSMVAAVQPNCLWWNSQKSCYKTFSSTCRPRLYVFVGKFFFAPSPFCVEWTSCKWEPPLPTYRFECGQPRRGRRPYTFSLGLHLLGENRRSITA